MPDIPAIVHNFTRKTKSDGLHSALVRSAEIINDRLHGRREVPVVCKRSRFVDVLIVNGMDPNVPQCIRYRVEHKIEQLEAAGMSCARMDAQDFDINLVGDAHSIIFYRTMWTPELAEFARLAQSLNKRVYYDIDDLVIDTKVTDSIPSVRALDSAEREEYDDGVRMYGRMLRECEAAITTTPALAHELQQVVPEVYVNRNVASDEMVRISEKAIRYREAESSDEAGVASQDDLAAWELLHPVRNKKSCSNDIVRLGFFSGSSTHNDDFGFVEKALVRVLHEYPQVHMVFMGLIDVPEALKPFKSQVELIPFSDWRMLPFYIASVDVNLAPLADTLFNSCKSENKWVEAALVKVPTVASRVGAFEEQIVHGVTGMLCATEDEWYSCLTKLVNDLALRQQIGLAAYGVVHEHCLTVGTGFAFAQYLRKRQARSVVMVLPNLDLAGGILVALRHAHVLQTAGDDVTLVELRGDYDSSWHVDRLGRLPVRSLRNHPDFTREVDFRGWIDVGIGTMWHTIPEFLYRYGNIGTIKYLVQSYEPDFYEAGLPERRKASATYGLNGVEYLTISRWCQSWLKERSNIEAIYVPNGIDLKLFSPAERVYSFPRDDEDGHGRVRILVEGDSNLDFKNVDEAFRIINRLPVGRFEVWYLSAAGGPKPWYQVDRFLHAVPHECMGDVYRQCHILLKTSRLESFSYPPLEMMATGGAVVVARNQGNAEYLVDEGNCLVYTLGNEIAAAACIMRIVEDPELRETICRGGLQTAASRSWDSLQDSIRAAYE